MTPDFSKGLIPCIVQHYLTGQVLMLGYMNEEAYLVTNRLNKATFFSRSRQRLWIKGEESGNFLYMKDLHLDCDNDTFLLKADPQGPTCHKGTDTCFETDSIDGLAFLAQLESIIKGRKENPVDESYTTSLFQKGVNKIAQKVGEEAVELVIEAKDNNRDLFLGEAADLLFHYLILLREKNVDFAEVISLLQSRHKKR